MPEQTIDRRRRLHNPDELLPWRRADKLEGCTLYWMPVKSFPIPDTQRLWLIAFIDALARRLEAQSELRCETFLQMSAIYPDLRREFQESAFDSVPMIGVSWSSSTPPPVAPADEVEEIRKGNKTFKFGDHVSNYCYWFLNKSSPRWRQMFLGQGGMTFLFMPPDPNTKAPVYPIPAFIRNHPHFQSIDLDGMLKAFAAMKDKFPAKSKELFGTDPEGGLKSKGIFYVLPRLTTRDFFNAESATLQKWFQLFDVYIAESVADEGILLASKSNLDDELLVPLHFLRERGQVYPEA